MNTYTYKDQYIHLYWPLYETILNSIVKIVEVIMKNNLTQWKKWFSQYPKTIINTLLNVFIIGLIYSSMTAIYTISGIRAGEYPGQSSDMISEQLNIAIPNIIIESLIKCLLIMIILFIPVLIYRFRIENKINLLKKFKLYLQKKSL